MIFNTMFGEKKVTKRLLIDVLEYKIRDDGKGKVNIDALLYNGMEMNWKYEQAESDIAHDDFLLFEEAIEQAQVVQEG